jgi:hypothetical protein
MAFQSRNLEEYFPQQYGVPVLPVFILVENK